MKQKQPNINKMSDDLYVNQFKKVMQSATPPKIVRSVGDLNMVEVDGRKVYRQKQIYFGNMEHPDVQQDIGWVKCQDTDNHFVYRHPDADRVGKPLGWTTFCTCGSPAVIVGYDAYKNLGSNTGALLVCMHLLYNKRHQDGGM